MHCTPRARRARDDRVAVVAVRDLDDEDEPAAAVAAGVRAGQPEPALALELREGPAVGRGDARPALEHRVEAVELGQADGGVQVAQAVVEAEPVVVEPAHVRGAALVALAVDARLDRPVGGA